MDREQNVTLSDGTVVPAWIIIDMQAIAAWFKINGCKEWHVAGIGPLNARADGAAATKQPAVDSLEQLHVRHTGGGRLAWFRGDDEVREIGVTPGWNHRDRDEFIVAVNARNEAGAKAIAALTRPPGGSDWLREALESIQQYGSDTLSGRMDGPDDRQWQRDAVLEMTRRATAALASPQGAEYTQADLNAEYTRGRCDGFDAAKGVEQRQEGHQWDADGERCMKCGDKDWMGSTCNATPHPAQAASQDDASETVQQWAERIFVQFKAMGERYDAFMLRQLIHFASLASPAGVQAAQVSDGMVLDAYQLRCAAEFAAPDYEKDEGQRDTALVFQRMPERTVDGEVLPAGMVCWYAEYPEEGYMALEEYEEYTARVAATAPQPENDDA